ncbi:MAG: methyltransferase domain-containing protein [Nitrososphaerales archaeon]|nr:methyltransferase domain-containing protein [Nitrososphaerales archaeon]
MGSFLDSRLRKTVQPPDGIIKGSGIREGMTVMDLGCGPGTYTIDVARSVGKDGKVYAIDIQKKMIEKLEKKLERKENNDIVNVVPKVAGAYDLPFPDDSLDLVYMISVLEEIPDKDRALREVHRVLKKNGILSISEFLLDPDYPLKRTVRRRCERAGFFFEKSEGRFFNYTVRFQKR